MKIISLLLFIMFVSCNTSSPDTSNLLEKYYKIVNEKGTTGVNRTYDVFIADKTKFAEVNDRLSSTLDNDAIDFIQINYYDDEIIAGTFMDKQLSPSVKDKEKNELFSHYLGNYRHNHKTGYKKFSGM